MLEAEEGWPSLQQAAVEEEVALAWVEGVGEKSKYLRVEFELKFYQISQKWHSWGW